MFSEQSNFLSQFATTLSQAIAAWFIYQKTAEYCDHSRRLGRMGDSREVESPQWRRNLDSFLNLNGRLNVTFE